jgi:hypothetical protein
VLADDNMAYVPAPIKYDLFLSYAHEDKAWVNALQEQLTERLLNRLGCDSDVWQDENKLRTGQNWADELDKAIRASAAFIAVVSRNYQNSKWCERELDAFLDQAERKDGLETGGYGRFLKVIKFPWLRDAHEGFHRKYQHVDFFDRDSKSGQEREFRPISEAFRKAVDKLGFHIEKLFEAMLCARERVFVARSAEDASEERESIIREIKAAGYALSPPPAGAIPRGLDPKTLRQFIGEARVTVHLLGAAGDPAVREEIDLALGAERKVVFYLTRGHESATGEQKKLIEEIRENRWNLREGAWALLESRSPAVLRQDLIGLLAPPRPTAAGERDGKTRVYLLCDPTSPEDAGFARELQGKIQEKEHFNVELQQAAADFSSPANQHERLLQGCDGLLLYYEKAPLKWYSRNFADLLMAEDRTRQRELKSKALLVGGSKVVIPGLTVIQRRDPFDLQQLEPFLAPLRLVPAGPEGAAHAGS